MPDTDFCQPCYRTFVQRRGESVYTAPRVSFEAIRGGLDSVARRRLESEADPGAVASVLIVVNDGGDFMWAVVFDCAEEVVLVVTQHTAIEAAN